MSRITRLYARRFRERYGAEIAEMLETSDRPVLDSLDIALHALRQRLEITMNKTTLTLALFAALLASASMAAFGFALADLAGGLRDVPKHWWSTLPLAGISIAAVMGFYARNSWSNHSQG